ncbi:MAG: hypothetical protein LBN07_05025 [Christensenellaceae bacterium]|jgi:hypothetical protein|nr:hypothetical protein [Christensenellaceae bacterium]
MKSFILRSLIVISLLGIIVVVGIMFFQNLNAEIRTADEIAHAQDDVNFSYLNNEGRKLRTLYEGAYDEYAIFVCDKSKILQQSIEKYLGFLRYAKGLGRNEASQLVELNKAYVEALSGDDGAVGKLENYHEYYAREDMPTNPSVRENLKGVNADFVRQYNRAYAKGMVLYDLLKEVVFKYTYDKTAILQFSDVFYDAMNRYAAETYSAIDTNMINRKESNMEPVTALNHYDAYKNFVKLKSKEYYLNDASIMTNTNLITFVNAYNAIDFRLLITDIRYQSEADSVRTGNINIVKQYFLSMFNIDLSNPVNVD